MKSFYKMRVDSEPKITDVRDGSQVVIPKLDINSPFFEYFSRYDYLSYIQTHQPPPLNLERVTRNRL